MKHYGHISESEQAHLFYKQPIAFDKTTSKELLSYALGATLYIPGVNDKLYECLTTGKYPALTTMVVCLEDGIADSRVEEAEEKVKKVFERIEGEIGIGSLDESKLPLMFVRTRHTKQLARLLEALPILKRVCGFVLPKFNSIEGGAQLQLIEEANARYDLHLYAMPILETKQVMSLETQTEELLAIKHLVDQHKEMILNMRIGATDFSSLFGLRRGIDFTIYDIGVIRDCITKIMNVFGQAEDGYVISGPVWEYFNGKGRLLKPEIRQTPFNRYGEEGNRRRREMIADATDGLIKEIVLDKANGFVGKTIIHPTHITYVNAIHTVTREEYEDAMQILGAEGGVLSSSQCNKMNEVKPHTNWAQKIYLKSQVYGVLNEDEDYTALF